MPGSFYRDFSYSVVDAFIRNRLDNDRDAKILITSRNSETGTGKTTLGILLAKRWDKNGWTYQKGFLNPIHYNAYYNLVAKHGDVLILDDAQASLDSRRSTSKVNVNTSKYWTLNRYKNVVSILTLTTQTMIDKRMLELADIWINIRWRGYAVPYRIYIDDITKKVRTFRIRHPLFGYKEEILFKKYSDMDYDLMCGKKDAFVEEQYEEDYDKSMRDVVERELGISLGCE